MAVDGRPPEILESESGEVERISDDGIEREIESSDSRENIVLSVSKRESMTMSLYDIKTIRLTSNA
jgi:hypothetical protein